MDQVSIGSDNGSAPSHYLNQCWIIVNWTRKNKLLWNFNQNAKLSIHENASENIVCKMAPILLRESWVKMHFGGIFYIAQTSRFGSFTIQCIIMSLQTDMEICHLIFFIFTLIIHQKQFYIHSPFTSWASYQIRKLMGWACAGNAGNVFTTTAG